MCSCNYWRVTPPDGSGGRRRDFTTEAQAKDYAARFPGATIRPPTKKK